MSVIVYLIRHATPDWSRTDIRYDIPPGPPLTPQGEEEAAQLGQFLANDAVSHIYASPLERTQRTAQIAGEVVGVAVETEEKIAEWRKGESEPEVQDRCKEILGNAVEEARNGGPVALVSHGGPIRTLLQSVGVEQAEISHYQKQFDRGNPVPPTGVWRLAYDTSNNSWTADLVHTPKPYTPYHTVPHEPVQDSTQTVHV